MGNIDARQSAQDTQPEIARLIEEAYGPNAEAFLDTPRTSLGDITPREALEAGEREAVRAIVVNALLGHWS